MSSHTHSVALSHNTTLTAASNQLQLQGQAQGQPPAPGLQEATRTSTQVWQHDLEQLFHHAKERFPDVVWELGGDEDEDEDMVPDAGAGARVVEEVWGHKAIVYARAPPSFQNRYFSFRPAINNQNQNHNNGGSSPYPAESALSLGLPLPPGGLGLGLGHSLGLEGSVASFTSQPPRTPSPFRASSPSTTLAHSHTAPSGSTTLLRLTTSISPALFSDELEYLYTGKGFGEAFEFLFDSSEGREHVLGDGTHTDDEDAEAQRVDKLRKDLVYMWRSRLYSDVRIALTGNFGGNHESTTAIFSSHRFILVSRSAYFADALSSWPTAAKHLSSASSSTPLPSSDPPTLNLPSPPFTPASLHFTLGFLYTGTLIFSHRSYDLSTAFTILKAALYLSIPSLHDEIQARIVQEMMHGLFHAFIPFAEYERLTGGRWGTGGCRCRQCARRAPRVLEFALEEDVRNQLLERGARRALVGLFGEGWCTQEFALLPPKIRESLLKGVGKRTTVTNVFPLLFAAEHALGRVAAVIEPWGDVVRDMLTSARRGMDELLARESEACFGRGGSIASAAVEKEGEEGGDGRKEKGKEDEGREEWMEIMESDGVRFDDGEKVEWVMNAVLRGVKEPYAATLYQTLVSSILLRPHPQNPTTPLLPATSHVRVQVEQARLDLLKWIGGRWLGVRQAKGFDLLEGWALKEISDHIEVPIDDLLSPPAYSSSGAKTQGQGPSPRRHAASTALGHGHLRPISNHPHTSKVDADSDVASSMRVSVLSRSLPMRGGSGSGASTSTAGSGREHHQRREREREADAHSVRSARSGLSYASSSRESVNTVSTARHTHTRTHAHASNSTHSAHTARSTTTDGDEGQEGGGAEAEAENMSPAKRLASEVRAGRVHEMKDRPDSKLSPASPVLMRSASPIGVRQLSIVEPPLDEEEEEEGEDGDGDEGREVVVADNRTADGDEGVDEGRMQEERDGEEDRSETSSVYHTPPVRQKTLITRASLASIASRTSTRTSPSVRSKTPSASPSLHSGTGSKASKAKSPTPSTPTTTSTTRKSTLSLSTLSSVSSASVRSSQYSNAVSARPSSRGSTRSRLTSAGAASASKSGASPASRPVSRVSTRSISGGTAGTGASRPVSTATEGTFRTASTGSTPGLSTPIVRSRRTSTASTVSVSSVRTAGGRSATGSPVNERERARKVSGASVSSVASTVGSIGVGVSGRTPKRAPPVPVPAVDPTKLSPVVGRSKSAKTPAGTPKSPVLQSSFSAGSVKAGVVAGVAGGGGGSPASALVPAPTADKEKDKERKGVLVGALSRKFEAGLAPSSASTSVGEKKSAESVGGRRGVDAGRKTDADKEREREREVAPSPTLTVPPELPSKDDLELEVPSAAPPAPALAAVASSTPAPSPSDDMDMDDEPLLNTASQMTIRPKTKTHARSEVLSGVSSGSGSGGSSVSAGAAAPTAAAGGGGVGVGVGTNNEHKKTSSSASTSSVATLKRERRGSGDTLRTVSNKSSALSGSSGGSGSGAGSKEGSKEGKTLPPTPAQQQQPKHTSPLALPPTTPAPSLAVPKPAPPPTAAPAHPPRSIHAHVASNTPTGSTLEIGIPCIISSKRKRFKAYARYIGEVAGETGSWVGVEVPLPTSDTWGDAAGAGGGGYGYGYGNGNGGERQVDERQWNDGSWGGIRYFEIGGGGSEWEYGGGVYGDDRASRRRRVDAGSIGGSMGGIGMGTARGEKGLSSSLKRERERDGDQLSIAEERMIKSKRMRSVSPAVSDMSGTESRGLFVRPGQVLYVVDAVGADL